MTGPADEFDRAARNFLASVTPGDRIETLALATTLLVRLDDPRPIEGARAIVRAEAAALGVEWWGREIVGRFGVATGPATHAVLSRTGVGGVIA
jgi:hypothetical protein